MITVIFNKLRSGILFLHVYEMVKTTTNHKSYSIHILASNAKKKREGGQISAKQKNPKRTPSQCLPRSSGSGLTTYCSNMCMPHLIYLIYIQVAMSRYDPIRINFITSISLRVNHTMRRNVLNI